MIWWNSRNTMKPERVHASHMWVLCTLLFYSYTLDSLNLLTRGIQIHLLRTTARVRRLCGPDSAEHLLRSAVVCFQSYFRIFFYDIVNQVFAHFKVQWKLDLAERFSAILSRCKVWIITIFTTLRADILAHRYRSSNFQSSAESWNNFCQFDTNWVVVDWT